MVVHHCKRRVDGITKILDNQAFEFDHAFGEEVREREATKKTQLVEA